MLYWRMHQIYRRILSFVGISTILLAVVANADILMLKDGKVLTGSYKSGTTSAIEFESEGSTKTYSLTKILSVTFQRSEPAPSAEPTPSQGGTINAGTRLMVRTETLLETGKIKAGERFTALLEADLVVDGNVLAARGSKVYGRVVESKKAGRIRGVAKLVIDLTDLMIGGQMFPLVTEQLEYEGQRSGTLKKVAKGAAVGGLIDGGDGAGKGAGVGVAMAVMTKGNQISIPAKSLIEFRITQALKVSR